jgi:gliding motility-associated-like protein
MKIRQFIFVICSLFQFSSNAQPGYCTLPLAQKSASISYSRIISSQPPFNNYRFFYKVLVECGKTNTLDLYDLFILNTSNGSSQEARWQVDSLNRVTGVIDPCLSLPTAPCYTIYYYHADVLLQGSIFGYTASTISCCRPGNAANLIFTGPYMDLENDPPPSISPYPCGPKEYPNLRHAAVIGNGLVSFINVPGPSIVNNSPQFSNTDTILFVCKNRPFSYQVSASDPDNDSLAYHFSQPRTFFEYPVYAEYKLNTFPQILYNSPFSYQQPLGSGVTLDPLTGLMQGTISDTGTYVVTISVPEYRFGKPMDSITKDLSVRVYDCSLLPKPKASIPDTLNSCSDFTINFPNYSFPLDPANNFTNTTFQWNFGDGNFSSIINPSHTYADTGIFNVSLIEFPGLYCADTAYSKVLMYPYVNASFNYSDSCTGQQILFTNTSSSTSGIITNAQWKILEDSNQLFSSNDYNSSFSFTKAPQTYEVFLSVENDKGCIAIDSQYINISQSPYPLQSHDTILARGASLQLEVNDGNKNYGGQYSWSPVFGLNDPNIPDPVLNSTIDNTYYVSIVNRYGCSLEDSIHVKYYTGPDIYVPNAFTPNDDGINDILRPIPVGISKLNYFRVFDRNGQLVFQTSQAGQGWDGRINGDPAVMNTYVWEVKGIDYTGKTIFKKGTVVLIR